MAGRIRFILGITFTKRNYNMPFNGNSDIKKINCHCFCGCKAGKVYN